MVYGRGGQDSRCPQARKEHADAIGWKLEEYVASGVGSGFDDEPTVEASQIHEKTSRAILFDFLCVEASVEKLARNPKLRARRKR